MGDDAPKLFDPADFAARRAEAAWMRDPANADMVRLIQGFMEKSVRGTVEIVPMDGLDVALVIRSGEIEEPIAVYLPLQARRALLAALQRPGKAEPITVAVF